MVFRTWKIIKRLIIFKTQKENYPEPIETLSIIIYQRPITRSEIENIKVFK